MAKATATKPKPGATSSGSFDARVDAKIAGASLPLQPVLNHLRALVHDTVPGVTETIKWGMAFFEVDGVILAHMGVFKNHCSFGFWSRSMGHYLAERGMKAEEGAGSFGRLTALDDLPAYKVLAGYVRYAAAQISEGTWESPFAARTRPGAKPQIALPEDFVVALEKSPKAKVHFDAFAPSCQREYIDWITTAKREETRTRRIAEAVAAIAQGKQRNWQYVK